MRGVLWWTDLFTPANFAPAASSRNTVELQLARAAVGRDELAVAGGPDAGNAAARAEEKSGRRQCHKGQQECVFDEVLSLIIVPKVVKGSQFIPTSLSASSRALHPRNPLVLSIAAAPGK